MSETKLEEQKKSGANQEHDLEFEEKNNTTELNDKEKEELDDIVTEVIDGEIVDLEKLNKKQLVSVVSQVVSRSQFSGPIPPPNIMKGYEDILPGSADRILKMAENQSEHRRTIESKCVNTEARDSLLGVVFAFLLSLIVVITGLLMVLLSDNNIPQISGSLISASGVAVIVKNFIFGTRNSWKSDKNMEEAENEEE